MRDDSLADHTASPLNPLPGVVWVLILAMVAVEAVLSAAGWGLVGGARGVGWRIAAIEDHAFSSALQHWMLETRRFPPGMLSRYLTFPFVHGAPMHALLSVVMLAALGKMLAPRLGVLRFLVLVLGVPVLAAIVFGLVVGQDRLGWLFGAMPMAFALVGAFTWSRWHEAPDAAARRRAFSLIGMLLGVRLAFGLIAETGPSWVADLSAFAIGFALTALVLGPGSWARTRSRLRLRG